jgi:hypothetical protein
MDDGYQVLLKDYNNRWMTDTKYYEKITMTDGWQIPSITKRLQFGICHPSVIVIF